MKFVWLAITLNDQVTGRHSVLCHHHLPTSKSVIEIKKGLQDKWNRGPAGKPQGRFYVTDGGLLIFVSLCY